jgi:hypothetical protein
MLTQDSERALRTAAQKQSPVSGTLAARIAVVKLAPNSGLPELSSKIEPTAAIAATQEPARNRPLRGVIAIAREVGLIRVEGGLKDSII